MIQKVFATLLIAAALFGCYQLYLEYATSQRLARNPWLARMTPLIRLHTAKEVKGGGEKASESSYLRLLYLAWQASEDGYSALDTAKRAAAAAGAEQSEAARIGAAIHENVQIAKSMGVFDDVGNAVGMERGEPPTAHAKGWEDERLVVGYNLSPVLAPEAAFAIPNLRLMPESVRDMLTDRATSATVELARKWVVDKIIYPESYRAIATQAEANARQ